MQAVRLRGSQSLITIFFFFKFSRVSPGDQPLAKEPEDSGYEIDLNSIGSLILFNYMSAVIATVGGAKITWLPCSE